jgi:hypothetical protein
LLRLFSTAELQVSEAEGEAESAGPVHEAPSRQAFHLVLHRAGIPSDK